MLAKIWVLRWTILSHFLACEFPHKKRSWHSYLEKQREGMCRYMSPWTCWAPFKFIKSVGYSLQRWSRVQVNVSIRYLSFARKTFSTGLFLLNTMTRNVHREIKEMCLPLLLLICTIYSRMVTLFFFCLASMDFLRGPEVSFKIPENKLYLIQSIG